MQNLVFSTLISHASRTRHAVFLFRPDKVFRPLSNRNYFFKKFFCTALFCRSSSCFIKPVDLFKALSGDALSPGYRTLYLRIEQETTAGRRPLTAQKRDAAPAKHVCRHIRPVTVHINQHLSKSYRRVLHSAVPAELKIDSHETTKLSTWITRLSTGPFPLPCCR